MKGHEAKMPRMEDILSLPVQDPPYSWFSAAQLNWVKMDGGRQGGDHIVLVPYARVDDFVKGESANAECPASFRVESRRKRPEGSVHKPRVDGYLEYTLYWCSYGPEDYRNSEMDVPDVANVKPASGKGSRPGRHHMMRGCLCHFTVKRLYTRPLVALIIYNQRTHVDKSGSPCHGMLDHDAVGTRAMYAPRISEELRQKVMSLLYVGMSLENIMQHHMDEVRRLGGPCNRDDFLTRNDVRNMERLVHASFELRENDKCSVKIWVHRNRKHVFFSQDGFGSEPFILGVQTEWQLQQMLRYGNNGLIATHSVFGSKRLKYPLCSLLVFDSSRNPIPVAWIISPRGACHDIHKWISALIERIRTKDPRWRPYAFLMDNPSFDTNIIRETFQCRVLLCLSRIRRAWVKRLLKKCCNSNVQREMLKHLTRILYCTRSAGNTSDAVEEFIQIFVDQCDFMDYFRNCWLPNIELWVKSIRTLTVSNGELCGAIEAYHLRLKSKLFNELHASCWERVDWLIHTLTTEFHSSFWLDCYALDMGFLKILQDRCLPANSWYQAMHIPDADVLFDEENLDLVKVICQTDPNTVYTLWNPGSEFSLCDCHNSRLGNLCKHSIKVMMLCKNRQSARPLLSSQVYGQSLLSLLHNPPDDPPVLNHAILHANSLQQDIKGLEDLSNSVLLQPLSADSSFLIADSVGFSTTSLMTHQRDYGIVLELFNKKL